MISKIFGLAALLASAMSIHAGTISLGSFTFNDSQFGNSLVESDGGTFRSNNWLNVANANPGNPGALTGPNFNTGIANIGLGGVTVDYTIGYNTPIVNSAGTDFALVGGYSFLNDTFHIAVSTDGITFTPFQDFLGSTGVNSGVNVAYFYSGGGPYATNLEVIAIDLSSFGIAAGTSVSAIRIEGRVGEEPDIIRVAGTNADLAGIPEPVSVMLMGSGLMVIALLRRRR